MAGHLRAAAKLVARRYTGWYSPAWCCHGRSAHRIQWWWLEMLLEGLLCGALTLTAASGPEYLSIGIGGGIGFIGVEQFRKLLLNIPAIRFGGNPKA
jgi:hypothetical protein